MRCSPSIPGHVAGGRPRGIPARDGGAVERYLRFVSVGDSTTVGLGDVHPPGTPAAGTWRGWSRLLAAGLRAGHEVSYLNLAVSGATTAEVWEQPVPHAVAHRPDIASLVVGVNDTFRSGWNPARVREHVLSSADALHAAGAVLLTRPLPRSRCGVPPAGPAAQSPAGAPGRAQRGVRRGAVPPRRDPGRPGHAPGHPGSHDVVRRPVASIGARPSRAGRRVRRTAHRRRLPVPAAVHGVGRPGLRRGRRPVVDGAGGCSMGGAAGP